MELPTPAPGSDGTHDFLSLYATTSSSQDRSHPQSSPGGFIKTHNFLQPLEMHASKECNPIAVTTVKDNSHKHMTPGSVQHILPGGIGTYTISHISYVNQLPKPEVSIFKTAQASSNERNDDHSKLLFTRSIVRESASRLGQWGAEKPSQSSFNQHRGFVPGSSSKVAVQSNRSFMDLIVSTKSTREDPDDCEVDFVIKKEGTPSERDDFSMRAEGKNDERKANTPRSKHSATEQRRRSKINDRFQLLREIIPHSDQKRDKASFLLEAIEYIQYLQEKVHRYEGSFPGRNNESTKLIPSRNKCQPSQGFGGNCKPIHVGPSVTPIHPVKLFDKNIGATATISRVMQNQGDSGINIPVIVRPIPPQPKMFVERGAKTHVPATLVHDKESAISRHPQHDDVRHCKMECALPNDELKDQEVNIEGGTINIASAYSQGFLNTLTHALESLGVDLSQSRISVQIDLGKQNNLKLCSSETMIRVKDSNPTSQVKANSSLNLASEYSGQAAKRLKTGNNL